MGCAGHKPLCSSRYLGQINTTDFFTRLLAGITFTGLAPASFYKDPSGPDRHFDGMCATCTLTLSNAGLPMHMSAPMHICKCMVRHTCQACAAIIYFFMQQDRISWCAGLLITWLPASRAC